MERDICKDNLICCDDNCQRCANLIYNIYMEQREKLQKAEEIKVKRDKPQLPEKTLILYNSTWPNEVEIYFEHLNDRVNALIDYLKARENNDSHS